MADCPVFDSRDERYKYPFGAVECNSEVSFTLRPLAEGFFVGCQILLYYEFQNTRSCMDLSPCGTDFHISFLTPDSPELIWYRFRFIGKDGSMTDFGKNGYGDNQNCWQLTVYHNMPSCGDWFGQGVTYQIFPDRFCRTHLPEPANMLGERTIHTQWNEPPHYLPDENGEIHNNDFFGGNLQGIIQKLDLLERLSVTTIYLCPIFESDSNHRYNTADYHKIDPMLGTEADFRQFCEAAHRRGMRIILDGVFNHTGSNSRYFNACGAYPDLGAAQSRQSPYFHWYHFSSWPTDYDAWWGIKTLPSVNEDQTDYRNFIIHDANSVIRHWLRAGADGWRLDVADELPDDFIAEIRQVMYEEKPDSFLLGEVWEDGSNKIAYSQRRRYLLGSETNGLMNYPLRTEVLRWLLGGDAAQFRETMETLRENYPKFAYYNALNSLSTHDTPRILTLLGCGQPNLPTKDLRAAYRLSPEERALGFQRLQLATILLFSFPGSPTIFYGDEAGMEGFEDPLNRGTYPWGREDTALLEHYIKLGKLRKELLPLQQGDISYLMAQEGGLVFQRTWQGKTILIALNAGSEPLEVSLPWRKPLAQDALTHQQFFAQDGFLRIAIPPIYGFILV